MVDFEENNGMTRILGKSSSLENAIDLITAVNGGCFCDPRHYHSFRGVAFLLPLNICGVCHQRLSTVSPFSNNQVVQCVACKLLAHRICALSKSTEWSQPCPVNYKTYHQHDEIQVSTDSEGGASLVHERSTMAIAVPDPARSTTNDVDYAAVQQAMQQEHPNIDGVNTTSGSSDAEVKSGKLEWTTLGPPAHWATGKSLEAILPSKTDSELDSPTIESEEQKTPTDPLYIISNPFACVSRTLHENVLVHFRPVVERILLQDEGTNKTNPEQEACKDETTAIETSASVDVQSTHVQPSAVAVETCCTESLLKEAEIPNTNKRRLGLATVAGSIAGGVVGMAVAGPMGGVIGAKFGQTAGILGVVLEGSWTIGVITSGIVAGRNAGQQLQDKLDEKRVLALSGTGTSQGVLLVRPSVKADPAWAIFCEDAKRSHKKALGFNFLVADNKAAHWERYEREIDIVNTDENEIPTADKVLLLVSRILNDKDSLPGHVYRQLIEKFKERVTSRGELSEIIKVAARAKPIQGADEDRDDEEAWMEKIRARRQDAHSVIKYVTATLLELRPGFASSPSVTEYTATAVEALVFGELYDLVIEEIEAEFEESENDFLEKVANFERLHAQDDGGLLKYKSCTSEDALASLRHLPQAHSAVDKLRYCVIFLEKIADFFSNDNAQNPMGADSLLKLVCQHILAAKVFATNAQIAFLEEFARDEQLLRGKEGYALVTLQASLHFLNASSDFDADIFNQEDD
jgi:hypothetical protein